MEALAAILIIVVVVFLVLPILTFVKLNGLAEEIRLLRQALADARQPDAADGTSPAEDLRVPPDGEEIRLPNAVTEPEPVSVVLVAPGPSRGEPVRADPPVVKRASEPSWPASVREPPPAPTALDLVVARIGDWLLVRGAFAPPGVTREFAVATRWLVRVGLLILVFSVAYFVKLSVDRGWMGPTARVASTVLWGAVGVVGGVALAKRTRYEFLGHAFSALGFVALYLGFGLGHRFFTPPVIASPALAFAALALVTVAMGVVSVTLPSATIAVMGLVAGYLVPVIAGRDTGAPLGICIYLLVLNLGAYAVARLRAWSALDFLAAMTSAFILWGWCAAHPGLGRDALLTVFAFLLLIHALYLVSVVRGAQARGSVGNSLAWTGLALNATVLLGWLGLVFRGTFPDPVTGLVFLGLVAAYLLTARFATRRGWMDRASVAILLVFALVFLALSPLLVFGPLWCVVSWSLMGVAVVEAERRTQEQILGVLAFLLLIAAAGAGLFFFAPGEYIFSLRARGSTWNLDYAIGLLLRIVRLWTLPLALGWVAARKAMKPLLLAAAVCAFLFLTGEALRFGRVFLPGAPTAAITLAWALAASCALFTGVARGIRFARMVGLALLGAAVGKLLFVDTIDYTMPIRVGVFATVGVLLMVGAFLYMKFRVKFERKENEGHEAT